ncbi:hypothetical protein SAMN04487936_106272 [Halobacillus dabanensis]|uniref:Uncharacterized protein n=1 Tax=Halobacillus dabanensis TaxID=240302 RepID=A0A1I3W9Y1_HALDA|nr:hypothetical protein [Halobacillus dabanensis]SFK04325.1 hypothetical protein SAMN04487936_106272 [Halobacillus dabanensis]
MAIISDAPKKKLFGPNDKRVKTLIDRLINMDWYHQIGTKNVKVEEKLKKFMEAFDLYDYEKEWVSIQEVPDKISNLNLEDTKLWDRLKEVPERINNKGIETGRKDALDLLVSDIPELVYHGSFKGAYRTYQDQKAVSLVVGHALYVSLLACTWEVIADQAGWENNPFLYLIDILEEGHLPIGPQQNIFYLV